MDNAKLIDDMIETGTRFMDAADALKRAIAAEGTPAIKDILAGYELALAAALDAHTNVNNAAAEEIAQLRAAVQS